MSEDHTVLHLPLPRGSLTYLSIQMGYVKHQGWYARIWHKHDGEVELCGPAVEYDSLDLDELVDVVSSVTAAAHYRYRTAPDGTCQVDP